MPTQPPAATHSRCSNANTTPACHPTVPGAAHTTRQPPTRPPATPSRKAEASPCDCLQGDVAAGPSFESPLVRITPGSHFCSEAGWLAFGPGQGGIVMQTKASGSLLKLRN
jgi:hypothetical protein